MPRLLLCLLVLAAAAAGNGLPATAGNGLPAVAGNGLPTQPVSLRPEVTVEAAVLRLSDLFDGLDAQADADVARAPAPGRQLRLSGHWLRRLARAHNLAWQPGPGSASALVRRASQVIGPREIVDAIARSLDREGIGGDLDVILDSPGLALHLPVGSPLEIEVAALSYDPRSERLAAKVVVGGAGADSAQAVVRGRALQMTEVPVLRHRLARDQVIGPGDLEWTRVPVARLGRRTVLDAAEIVGKSLRRSVRPGRQLRDSDLQAPVVVAKNSLVTLRLETPQMRLTVQGRALDSGGLGEVVRVVNTKSNTMIYARISGPNSVVVDDRPAGDPQQEALR